MTAIGILPLRSTTPPSWVCHVMRDPLALLNDHAHLEKKAASNALELLHRWPPESDEALAQHWVRTLTGVARDEVEHLASVCRQLARRGGRLSKMHRNPYAAALRDQVRIGEGNDELGDRLMVCALIELRSCERFEMLARHVEDQELARLYQRLAISEQGHYLVFVDLARRITSERVSEPRWQQWLDVEAEIMTAQRLGTGMHSWIAE